jgi:UDPglucose 6-dehydrogenase
MHITVVGTGYVGLVTGTCFAEMGNHVTCVDIDAAKINKLEQGIIPIFEPGLDALVKRNYEEGRLQFTTSLAEAMQQSNIYFIAVGTPPDEDGSADLQYVIKVAEEIGRNISSYAVVVNKSTVPIGTAELVERAIATQIQLRNIQVEFDVVSNPEFLKEGAAIDDFMKPDRIVVGAKTEKARQIMQQLYIPFNKSHERVLFMNVRDAEMTKYVANCMLATKISFMNEIANLCDRLKVDVENVRIGIGSDTRIGYSFIYPGVGYGGSCFPKDVKALVKIAQNNGYQPWILEAVERRNDAQKHILADKVVSVFGDDLSGKVFAVWGLAFKPGTDDMREAASITIINDLLARGASIRAFDPVATHEAQKAFSADAAIHYGTDALEVCETADALLIVTEWKQFKSPDFDAIKARLKTPVIIDGRNLYEPSVMADLGIVYLNIGRARL